MIPNGARIVVRRKEAESVTAGGIEIPDSAREVPYEGEVLYAGPESVFSKGHQVVFSRFSGTDLRHDGETLVILEDRQVLLRFQD